MKQKAETLALAATGLKRKAEASAVTDLSWELEAPAATEMSWELEAPAAQNLGRKAEGKTGCIISEDIYVFYIHFLGGDV